MVPKFCKRFVPFNTCKVFTLLLNYLMNTFTFTWLFWASFALGRQIFIK
jgi:hypothetical protein